MLGLWFLVPVHCFYRETYRVGLSSGDSIWIGLPAGFWGDMPLLLVFERRLEVPGKPDFRVESTR